MFFGVGPVIAATILGDVPDPARFADRDHFAACNDGVYAAVAA